MVHQFHNIIFFLLQFFSIAYMLIMENYTSPLVSTHPQYSQNYNYADMLSSLRNLDLSSGVYGNRGSCSRNNDHGLLDALYYSPVSPRHHQCVNQNNAALHRTWTSQINGEPLYAPVPSVPSVPSSFVYNEANQVPGIPMSGITSPAYDPSYVGGSAMNQNGYFGQGNGQNLYRDQGFTKTSSNGQNGYGNEEFTEMSNGVSVEGLTSIRNPQDTVSMATGNVNLIFLQNVIMAEQVLCLRILNEILCLVVPQLEQQTLNKISGSAQGSQGPTDPKRIFVGGLASTVTESDFKTYFDQFGTITKVGIIHDHITQRSRGFGFISFDSKKAVDKVLLRTSFHELKGKMVEVKRAIPKDPSRKSIRRKLDELNYRLSKVNCLLRAYTQDPC